MVEGKPWMAVEKWLRSAEALGQRVPFVVWDAKNVHRWLGWGLLVDASVKRINEGQSQTEFRFQNLRPLGDHRRSDLVLLEQGRPLSDDFLRSYARLRTPQFLHDLAEQEGPLLSEWLCMQDAVAHAFRVVYEDERERAEVEQVLGRALLLADQAAPGGWGVILTPGRIRVVVGDELIVEMGHPGADNLTFYPGPEDEQEEDDPDSSLTDLFTKYERHFMAHLERLRAARPDQRSHAEVARDYLVAQGHAPAPLAAVRNRRSHAEVLLEYLVDKGYLPAHVVRSGSSEPAQISIVIAASRPHGGHS